MNARPKSLSETFLEYFDVSYAKEEYQRDDVGRIRYSVYCGEFGYEDGSAFPDGIERDEFDDSSLHCLITHKSTSIPAGCVRVVLTTGGGQLPFEKFCKGSLDGQLFKNNPMSRESICEISRLAVDGQFRRRKGEHTTRFGIVESAEISLEEHRTFPLITVSCFLAATVLGALAGCTRAFAMMEPFLPRLLSRSAIPVKKVGQDIDYHGLRAPYFMTLEETLDTMIPELRQLYDAIFEMFQKDFSGRDG